MNVKKELLKYKDSKFKDFESNLVPNIDKSLVIGVKNPFIRKISKSLYLTGEYKKFIDKVPHKYLEENLVHIHTLNLIKDYDEAIYSLKKIVPYMNNWMVTDTVGSRTFEKNKDKLTISINKWLKSRKPYTIRLAIILLKKYFLDDLFKLEQLNKVISIKHDDYYVKMMQAWYIAEGLIKHEKEFLNVIKKKKLDSFIQNKSIQKARESYRISNNLKKELLKYKV